MKPSLRGRPLVLLLVVCAGAAIGCGKKGPPLAPLGRIPQPPLKPAALRMGDDVYLSFGVPSANTSGQTPADITSIEVYAWTGTAPPPGEDPTKEAMKIGSYAVVPPPPPPSPPREGEPAPPPLPPPQAFVQGAQAVIHEKLTPETLVPTKLSEGSPPPPSEEAEAYYETVAGPLVPAPEAIALKRYYVLVAQGPRGRASTPTPAVAVPLGDPTPPPTDLIVEYTEKAMTVKWTPSPEAHVPPPPPEDKSLLPARPLVPPPAATRYHVFEASREGDSARQGYRLEVPAPLTPAPVETCEFSIDGPIEYGVERCFVVRTVETIGGAVAMGPASTPGCVTARDTFPPAPPQRLAAIAGINVINLIWEPNAEPDLAGYIVLRGPAPGDALQAITPSPIRETTYRDQSVRPGERYVYAVVAVDNANPQNVSGQSNRVEESSRAPR